MMAERQIRGVPSPAAVRPGIPKEIDAIVQRMGAKNPHERYPSAREVVVAMHSWLPLEQGLALGITAPEKDAAIPQSQTKPAKKRGFFARLFGW
jgi:serine/threonine-protein kinase